MADLNMPSISELGQMQFLAPIQYQQAQRNVDLATQFQNQNLQQGEYGLQKALMDNLYQQQNDPTKLAANKQALDTATSEGILKRIDAQQRQALAPQEQESKRAKFISSASDEKLADLMSRTQTDMMDPNAPPEKQQAAKEAFERSSKEWSARLKAKDELQKQAEDNASRERVGAGNNAATVRAAEIGAGSRENVARMKQKQQADYQQSLAGAKSYSQAVNIANAFAAASQDPDVQEYYHKEAARFNALDNNRGAAGAGVAAGTKIDPAATAASGVVTMQPNPATAVPPPTPRPASFSVTAAPRSDFGAPIPGMAGPSGPTNAGERSMAREVAGAGTFDPVAARKEVVKTLSDANDPSKPLSPQERDMFRAHAAQLQKQIAAASSQGQPVAPQAAPAAPKAPSQPTVRADGKVNVVRPDGQAGWISKTDLDEAIKNGWKIK